MSPPTFYALTPTFRPVGGVLKIFDYALHARSFGYRIVMCCPDPYEDDLPVFAVPGIDQLRASPDVVYQQGLHVVPNARDLVFFSWPEHYDILLERLPATFPDERIVHIVQNVRHANPRWVHGRPLRLLGRPMTRITVTEQVREAIAPYVNQRFPTTRILLGHRGDYFAKRRSGSLDQPIRVGYTTWKSRVGDAVRDVLAGAHGLWEFKALGGVVGWPELRELYRWADVFLATPGPEEGFYLPGLEAMAAGALVITPDVGGNMAYCRFDDNCLDVTFESVPDYVRRLKELADAPAERVDALRKAGWQQVERHSLTAERDAFADVIRSLDDVGPRAAPRRRVRRTVHDHSNDVVITGIPRSGTTLLTHLLNQLPEVVALSEPLSPSTFMPLDGPTEVVHAIEDFFVEQRQSLIATGRAISKNIGGQDRDNYFEESGDGGLRRDIAERSEIRMKDDLSDDFVLAIKDVPTCTALIDRLAARFRCYAVVRNPLAILASWNSVDAPFGRGRSPHAEWFHPDLGRLLYSTDEVERQIRLLDWWFEWLLAHVPTDHLIRYERLVSEPEPVLMALAPDRTVEIDRSLVDSSTYHRYEVAKMEKLAEALLLRGRSSLQLYGEAEITELVTLRRRMPPPQESSALG